MDGEVVVKHTNPEVPDNSYGAEVRFHIDNLVEMLMGDGMSREDAEAEARKRFGSPKKHDPRRNAAKRAGLVDRLRLDLGFAVRSFRRNPGFSSLVVLTLGLGIGATTSIFSVFNGVVLRDLPFADPHELMFVWERSDLEGVPQEEASAGIFRDWLAGNQTFEDMTAWAWDDGGVVTTPDGSPQVRNVVVSYPNFFEVLGVSPQLGRVYVSGEAEENQRGTVAVISDKLWREEYGGSEDVVGRSINVDGSPLEIVGVMPSGLAAPDTEIDVWVPAGLRSNIRWDRHRRNLTVIGRLADGVLAGQAQADLSRIAIGLREGEFSDIYDGWDALVEPMQTGVVGSSAQTIAAAFMAVGLVLIIACVNVANLLLARATGRSREMALRVAVGAGRGRLLTQLVTESVVLCVVAGLIGIAIAAVLHSTLLGLEPGLIPRVEELSIDGTAMVFAIGVSLVTGVLFGATPMLAGVFNLSDALREGGAGDRSSDSKAIQRLRSSLVVAQVTVTVILLASAGLLFRSLQALNSVDPGFNHESVVASRIYVDGNRYNSAEMVVDYYESVMREASAQPGVRSVGLTTAMPMDPLAINYDLPFRRDGEPRADDNDGPQADFRVVSPGYFETMSIEVVAGRDLHQSDIATSPFVMLVNEEFVRRHLNGQDPIGLRIETPSTGWNWFEIVGVVSDTRFYGPAQDIKAEMYMSFRQVPRNVATLVVSSANPATTVNPVRAAILEIDPGQPPHSILPVTELVRNAVGAERFFAGVIGVFAIVALVLSTVGLYGVISFWVGKRTREIGIRMALGARRRDVVGLVMTKTVALVAVGLGTGVIGAQLTGRAIESVLFQVSAGDPATIIGVTLLLLATAATASGLPAIRAARVDPSSTLRSD